MSSFSHKSCGLDTVIVDIVSWSFLYYRVHGRFVQSISIYFLTHLPIASFSYCIIKTGLPQLVFFPGQHGQYTLHNWLFPDCYSSHHINVNKQNWHQKSHDTRCSTIAIGSVVEPDFFAGAGEKAPAPGCCCVV